MTAFGSGLTCAGVVWQWSPLLPQKPLPFVKRFLRALWDAQAAFRSRFFRLEHRIDSLTPVEEEMHGKDV
jgi:hypothetical protein